MVAYVKTDNFGGTVIEKIPSEISGSFLTPSVVFYKKDGSKKIG